MHSFERLSFSCVFFVCAHSYVCTYVCLNVYACLWWHLCVHLLALVLCVCQYIKPSLPHFAPSASASGLARRPARSCVRRRTASSRARRLRHSQEALPQWTLRPLRRKRRKNEERDSRLRHCCYCKYMWLVLLSLLLMMCTNICPMLLRRTYDDGPSARHR